MIPITVTGIRLRNLTLLNRHSLPPSTSKGQRKAHQAVTPHSFSCTYPFATVYVQDVYPPLS